MARGFLNSAAGGGGGGKNGVFIIDATSLIAGDTVKVQSMIDPTQVWTEEIASGDTYILFEVPGKSYYKISLVQDIDDTPTEVVNVFRTLDEGQSILIDVLDKTSLKGIQAILDNHREGDLLSVGDEINLKLNGDNFPMLIASIDAYSDHEIILVGKNLMVGTTACSAQAITTMINDSAINAKLNAFYAGLTDEDKALLKEVYREGKNQSATTVTGKNMKVFLPNYNEVFGGSAIASYTTARIQFPIFTTATERIRTIIGGLTTPWWTCDVANGANATTYIYTVTTSGGAWTGYNTGGGGANSACGILPCICLKADI